MKLNQNLTSNITLIFAIALISFSSAFSQNSTTQFRNYVLNKDYEKAGEVAQQSLLENPNDVTLAVSVGDVFMELEDFDKALNAYSIARNLNPKDNNIVSKWGQAMSSLGRGKEAIEDIRKVLDKDKKNVSLLVALANAYLSAGDVKNAELQITNARSLDSKNVEVFTMLGNIYFEQSIWELARTNLEDALKIDTTNVKARQRLAEVYWQLAVAANSSGETDLLNEYLNRSLEQCNTLVRNDEKDANSWRLKAQIHFNAEQNLEAAQSYNKFLELRPNNYKERWRLASILAKNGVCEEAIPHLNMVLASNNEAITDSIKYQAKLYLGSCYFRQKQYTEAIKILNEADQKITLDPVDLKLLSLSYLFALDTTNALAHFDRLFAVEPTENCDIMINVARIYNAKKMFEDAIRIMTMRNSSCDQDDNTAYCYYVIGTANFELKKIDETIVALQKAIEINPNYFYAYIYLGDVYFNQKNTADGEKQFNYVLQNAKVDKAKYSNELNMTYQKLAGMRLEGKKYSELQKIAREWLETLPENNEYANLYLAVAYQGAGDQSNACKYYHEVLKINKENKTAKDNLKGLGC